MAALAGRQRQLAAAVTHAAAASQQQQQQQQQTELPEACGQYDRRTRRGKLFAGTNGLSRPKPSPKRSQQLQAGRIAVPQPGWQSPSGLQPYSISPPAQQIQP
ncbi:hypothetical protein OEZ85_008487 [Tetradesmus obliquus]|uniref:Uncharacterized protein n=1 Tax=Tetradesmus obliquus TaxID=3088 RepID=A0ABY8TIZ3_TETOB|nr:hypothetical protein OEZ85_008487 [Tetradesmus obliquus]